MRYTHGLLLTLVLLACGARDLPVQAAPVDADSAGRTCVALGVFLVAGGGGWVEQAAVAQTLLNAAGGVPQACTALPDLLGEQIVPARPLSADPSAWHTALSVVDAVISGDYTVAPLSCATANRFTRAEPPTLHGPTPAEFPPCSVGGLFFWHEPVPPTLLADVLP